MLCMYGVCVNIWCAWLCMYVFLCLSAGAYLPGHMWTSEDISSVSCHFPPCLRRGLCSLQQNIAGQLAHEFLEIRSHFPIGTMCPSFMWVLGNQAHTLKLAQQML